MIEGRITRISGPIVYAEGLDGCGLYDVVDVGNSRLIGEIIRLKEGNATIQVYEEDTGMAIGEKVVSSNRPLSLRLGPGLIGKIYDGIQRPLESMYEESGAFLLPGQRSAPLDEQKKYHFVPSMKAGESIVAGAVLGTVQETESVLHKIMVPPLTRGQKLVELSPEG
ncbi:MAG: V-type ATP synthase subunit A, partial [Spirochaetaceae bacterium]|nr:V-type ATP synthase subunit A [Spirochaetaceae bacterium]